MELYIFLAGQDVIEEVLEVAGDRKHPRIPSELRADPRTDIKRSKARECKCGTCRICRENARWEQIFSEKFADPDYYRRRGTVHGSSLNAWR